MLLPRSFRHRQASPRRRFAATRASRRMASIVAVASAPVWGLSAVAFAQCRPPANSNEARLLAFYEAPVEFATADLPVVMPTGQLALTGELVGVPAASTALTHTTYCFAAKQEDTHLSPVLPRLRLAIGRPAGFAI